MTLNGIPLPLRETSSNRWQLDSYLKTERSLCCLLGEVPWQVNEYVSRENNCPNDIRYPPTMMAPFSWYGGFRFGFMSGSKQPSPFPRNRPFDLPSVEFLKTPILRKGSEDVPTNHSLLRLTCNKGIKNNRCRKKTGSWSLHPQIYRISKAFDFQIEEQSEALRIWSLVFYLSFM